MVSLHQVLLPDNQDFLFHPTIQANFMLYSLCVNHETSKVLIKNASDRPLCIPRCHKLGHLFNISYNNCFLVNTQLAYDLAAFPPTSQTFSDPSVIPLPSLINSSIETVLDNGIKVYGDMAVVKQISELLLQYLSIWES